MVEVTEIKGGGRKSGTVVEVGQEGEVRWIGKANWGDLKRRGPKTEGRSLATEMEVDVLEKVLGRTRER